jgi:hypothetical protein
MAAEAVEGGASLFRRECVGLGLGMRVHAFNEGDGVGDLVEVLAGLGTERPGPADEGDGEDAQPRDGAGAGAVQVDRCRSAELALVGLWRRRRTAVVTHSAGPYDRLDHGSHGRWGR